jgi:hypothetical protein
MGKSFTITALHFVFPPENLAAHNTIVRIDWIEKNNRARHVRLRDYARSDFPLTVPALMRSVGIFLAYPWR